MPLKLIFSLWSRSANTEICYYYAGDIRQSVPVASGFLNLRRFREWVNLNPRDSFESSPQQANIHTQTHIYV